MRGRRSTSSKPDSGRKASGKYAHKRKVCPFCTDRQRVIDYKEYDMLSRFVSDRGKILPRRSTGACAKHQRAVAEAIKRARHLALLPYAPAHIHATGGVGVARYRGPQDRRYDRSRDRVTGVASAASQSPPEAGSVIESSADPASEPATEVVSQLAAEQGAEVVSEEGASQPVADQEPEQKASETAADPVDDSQTSAEGESD